MIISRTCLVLQCVNAIASLLIFTSNELDRQKQTWWLCQINSSYFRENGYINNNNNKVFIPASSILKYVVIVCRPLWSSAEIWYKASVSVTFPVFSSFPSQCFPFFSGIIFLDADKRVHLFTEQCISVLPIRYVLCVLRGWLVAEVWPEKLNVCSDSSVGKIVHGACFMSPHQNTCQQQTLFSWLCSCFGSCTQSQCFSACWRNTSLK